MSGITGGNVTVEETEETQSETPGMGLLTALIALLIAGLMAQLIK